jgi:hypothetical protein
MVGFEVFSKILLLDMMQASEAVNRLRDLSMLKSLLV